jgi:ABC-type multidrug transport system fused ATPase/permease subunit
MIHQSIKILKLIRKETDVSLIGLFILLAGGAILEMASIGIFVPLFNILLKPDEIPNSPILGAIYTDWADDDYHLFVLMFCLGMGGFYIIKALMLMGIIYFQNSYIYHHQALFSVRMLKIYLNRSYEFYLGRNSSELVRNVFVLTSRLFAKGFLSIVQGTMELLVMAGVLIVLLLIDPLSTTIVGAVLVVLAIILNASIQARIQGWGAKLTYLDGQILKTLNEAFGAIKPIKISSLENVFTKDFLLPNLQRAKIISLISTAPHLPRVMIELTAVLGLLSVLIVLTNLLNRPVDSILPTLGLFIVAAMRLMPSFSKFLAAATSLRSNVNVVDIIQNDISVALVERQSDSDNFGKDVNLETPILSSEIRLEGVSYSYPNSESPAVRDINLNIPHGTSVAFVGRSGAGKTTVVDLIVGLLRPNSGQVFVDGENINNFMPVWGKRIGYIPQEIYLTDDTLIRNVALGQTDSEIDDGKARAAVKFAQLEDVIEALPQGIDTIVGERGSILSGGQKQRVGIARAMYHDPDLLAFDEATSSLDMETEREVIRAIDDLKGAKTVIVIAHGMKIARQCDQIIFMEDGKISGMGTMEELLAKNTSFRRMVDNPDIETEKSRVHESLKQ